MNIPVIFAGGSGLRMNSKSCPKQFLELNGKPIIIHTIELFDSHPDIDGIVVVCLYDWIPFLENSIKKFGISKVLRIVPGGETGQQSIYNGLCAAEEFCKSVNASLEETIVLIHDGVRPLITAETITSNIITAKEKGNCVTCAPATETFVIKQDNDSLIIPSRKDSLIARAPQTFKLKDILSAHRKAIEEGAIDFIDSCTLMNHYGYLINTVFGPVENIKITTPTDYFIFRTLVQIKENQQILGY